MLTGVGRMLMFMLRNERRWETWPAGSCVRVCDPFDDPCIPQDKEKPYAGKYTKETSRPTSLDPGPDMIIASRRKKLQQEINMLLVQ